eukprot:jgi/Tetstr1/448777/TSEL_036011.t1
MSRDGGGNAAEARGDLDESTTQKGKESVCERIEIGLRLGEKSARVDDLAAELEHERRRCSALEELLHDQSQRFQDAGRLLEKVSQELVGERARRRRVEAAMQAMQQGLLDVLLDVEAVWEGSAGGETPPGSGSSSGSAPRHEAIDEAATAADTADAVSLCGRQDTRRQEGTEAARQAEDSLVDGGWDEGCKDPGAGAEAEAKEVQAEEAAAEEEEEAEAAEEEEERRDGEGDVQASSKALMEVLGIHLERDEMAFLQQRDPRHREGGPPAPPMGGLPGPVTPQTAGETRKRGRRETG